MKMKTKKTILTDQPKNAITALFKSLKKITLNNMNKKLFFLPFILMVFLFSCKKESDLITPATIQNETQAKSAACGTTEYMEQQLLSDPALKTRMGLIERDIQTRIANNNGLQKSITQVITIPVVVHVVYNLADQNISDAQVLSQIDALNEDYSRTNADAVNTPSVFQPYAANANIHFVLAKRDPNGNATSGITRTYTSNTSFSSNNYIKFDSYGGHNAWPTGQYLNIWVGNLGLCGYSTFPGAPASVDGVVVKYNCFGRVGTLQTSYNKGRTATHEIAHWLNVYHIWGDATCGDDLVNDTPCQEKANYDYPVFPKLSACSINSYGDMFMNYMDYSADGARNMMTQGQTARMNATLYGPRASILTSLGGTAPGTTTTTTVCNVPGGLNATLITQNSANLNWSSTGAVSYNLRYKPTTSSTWITASTASTSFGISNLSTATTYEVQVASVCSSTSSSAFSSSVTFTTLASSVLTSCNVPAGLSATFITKSGATLNWSSTGVSSYSVRYKPTTSTTWTNASTTGTSLAVSGLSSSTTYEFQVASVCSGTTLSNYSAFNLFTTLAAKGNRRK
ncbi:MAG: hypothetical protein A3F72_11130 [Bacteroidetes bacterium RIFCSPLOWO2_12_FULL_35_15]|nr:MAG: hypothetical protein A3F72_11130 [Bacteroidetes bacterium RIFCSPLOWO2_12_FULL_35_15]